MVERDRRRRQRALDIAALAVSLIAISESLRLEETATIGAQCNVVQLLFVAHTDEARRLPGDLGRLGDDGGDDLAMIDDRRGLEQRQLSIVERREPWGVLVREHSEDAG